MFLSKFWFSNIPNLTSDSCSARRNLHYPLKVIDFLFYEFIHVFVENVLKMVNQPWAIFRIHLVNCCSANIAGHEGKVTTAGFIPDGRHLASGSGDIMDFSLGCPFIEDMDFLEYPLC
ncbi:hypothetical protein C5167_016466 [Papaver somniferum]|nr:hypothetical protein C5167_016466 [Papaver somniferum]